MATVPQAIKSPNLERLRTLHRGVRGPFSPRDAASLLSLPLLRAQRMLVYLAARGWIARVRRGLYVVVPLDATDPGEWREDPWVVAEKTFAPCYIGGFSACEHWELTEQLFRDVVVVTSRSVRSSRAIFQGTAFRLHRVQRAKIFGTEPVWRKQLRVLVSDPSRTVVDILNEPSLGGGARHVADVLRAYFGSEHRNDRLLVEYVRRVGNRAVFKRLGYLVEILGVPNAKALLASCRKYQSAGLSALDPAVRAKGRIAKRWNLRVNVSLDEGRGEAKEGDHPGGHR